MGYYDPLDDTIVLEKQFYKLEYLQDKRGGFREEMNITKEPFKTWFPHGVQQISRSHSIANVFRGVHFQYGPRMAKAMMVTKGSVTMYFVDMRPGSLTFGWHDERKVRADENYLIYAPWWVGRAFYTHEETEIMYFHDTFHNPETSVTIDYNSTTIKLPFHNPILSDKDANGMSLKEWRREAKTLNLRFA